MSAAPPPIVQTLASILSIRMPLGAEASPCSSWGIVTRPEGLCFHIPTDQNGNVTLYGKEIPPGEVSYVAAVSDAAGGVKRSAQDVLRAFHTIGEHHTFPEQFREGDIFVVDNPPESRGLYITAESAVRVTRVLPNAVSNTLGEVLKHLARKLQYAPASLGMSQSPASS